MYLHLTIQAYVCRASLRNFPDFSYHLILVNLFEKKPEQLLLAFHNNQYILCADSTNIYSAPTMACLQ